MVPPNNANREPAPRETKGRKAGNVRIAGQGYLNASSVEKTTAYLTPLCGPYTVPESGELVVHRPWQQDEAIDDVP